MSATIHKQFQQRHIKRVIDNAVASTLDEEQLVKKLSDIETKLNKSKDQLDQFYKYDPATAEAKNWRLLQNVVDTYKDIRWDVREKKHGQHVSNAWLKYFEMYSEYKFFKPGREYRTFLNAELPGSAICALNHYMKTNSINYSWLASSYFPEVGKKSATGASSTPLGDSYGLYKKYPSQWTMSEDNNGDMTDIKCVLDLESRFGPSETQPGFDFYSSDAGIDVAEGADGELTFNDQELLNAKLHLGCGLTGLLLLRPGGSMILKQYTCFKMMTVRLILEYSECFEKFYLCKPLTSRPYNSEIYLIGVGFRGITSERRQHLIELLTNFDSYAGGGNTPEGSVDAIYAFARLIFTQQISFIDENVAFMKKYGLNQGKGPGIDKLKQGLYKGKKDMIGRWFTTYPVKSIDEKDLL